VNRLLAPQDAALIRAVVARLASAGVPSPATDAGLLVEHAYQVAASGDLEVVLEQLVRRREAREPLQLVLGRTWFRELELACAPGVFIPRPETEVVAGLAIAAASQQRAPTVVEPCCGTGAIALSIAAELVGARVVAGDVDPAAVELAGHNLRRLVDAGAGQVGPAAGSSVELVVGDLLDGFGAGLRGRVDVLVANPPYLPASDRGSWPPEVALHDPARALVGGTDGHEVVDMLLTEAPGWLATGGVVVVEIDERCAGEASAVARAAGLTDVRVEPDLTGAPRAVVARAAR